MVTVGDALSHAFVQHAIVRLPDAERIAITEWNGEAMLRGVPPGVHRVEVRALGYAPLDVDFAVHGDTTGAVFLLDRSHAELDTVRVTARAVPLHLEEYEARRRMAIGTFLSDSVLARYADRGLVDVLTTHIAGLMVNGHGELVTPESSNLISADGCGILIYLDGALLLTDGSDLELPRVRDLAGVEVYSRTSAPVAYRPQGNYCKVMLLWSKWGA